MERIMTGLCESVSDLQRELGEREARPLLYIGVCLPIIFAFDGLRGSENRCDFFAIDAL